jgi:hypothetical protein
MAREVGQNAKGGKVNIVIRGASILTGGTALVFAAAACGGGAPSTTSGGAPSTTSGTSAPPQASSSAAQSPAASQSVPFQFTDADPTAGVASYKYSITLGNITEQTTITPTGNAPIDAPPGQVILVATVTLTNSTSQQEPGVESNQSWGAPNLAFAVPQSAAGADGMKLITFTQASWQAWTAGSANPPPKGTQCYVSSSTPGDPGTLEKKYGGYCAAVEASVTSPNIAQASPDGDASGTAPQLAPGGSQQFTFYDGPVPQGIKGVRVVVTDQSGMNSGDWKLLG